MGRIVLALLLATIAAADARAEANTISIGVQYGTSMLPLMLMEHDHLLEKHAQQAGLGTVAVSYRNISGPVAMADGVLSGALDIGNNGAPSLLILWDKTRNSANPVRGFASVSNDPSVLVTRNPAVHGIADFTERDRIAVPGVKIALNAILLQMAAAKLWGPDNYNRLDARTTTLGHPDALAAMLSGAGDVTAHFSGPPFSTLEVKAGMRPILTAKDVLGDGWDMILFATTKFHDANPKLMGALLAALRDADAAITHDPPAAARIYLEVSGDKKSTVADILALITDPDTAYDPVPRSVMQFATFMNQVGILKNKPSGWSDIFFADVHQ
jgi:NitT/TauT family transport system substrate-binding protein